MAQNHTAGTSGDLRCHQRHDRTGSSGHHQTVSLKLCFNDLWFRSAEDRSGPNVRPLCVSVVSALELKDHLDKQAKTLSAGVKRKVRPGPQQWPSSDC